MILFRVPPLWREFSQNGAMNVYKTSTLVKMNRLAAMLSINGYWQKENWPGRSGFCHVIYSLIKTIGRTIKRLAPRIRVPNKLFKQN